MSSSSDSAIPVYDLPTAVLSSINLKDDSELPVHTEPGPEAPPKKGDVSPMHPDNVGGTSLTCILCNETFASLQEQKSHVKSDYHMYNLKQKMKGLQPVSESEFEKLVEGTLFPLPPAPGAACYLAP